MSVAIIPPAILGAMAAIGVGWYSLGVAKQIKEEEEPLDIGFTEERPQMSDLIDLGTGPMAEEVIGNEIRKAQMLIFVSGAINRTLYNILRKNVPRNPQPNLPNVPLQLLVNKNFGRIFIRELQTRFKCDIKETKELRGDREGEAPTITIINIDGKMAIMFNEDNHQVFTTRDQDAANRITSLNRQRWTRAKVFTED